MACFDAVKGVGDIGDVSRAGHGLFDDRAPAQLAHVLAEVPDGHAAVDGHLASVGLFLADEQPEDRGLSRPVWPHEPNLLALEDPHGGFKKEQLRAVLLSNLIEADHGRSYPDVSCRDATRSRATAPRRCA